MGATVQAQIATGAGPSLANAETGVTFNREDTQTGTTPIPIPTAAGTNFSWLKYVGLVITATAATTISNRRFSLASAAATGLAVHFKAVASASYAQAASGNMPAASGSNGNVPTGFTASTTSPQVYDSSSVSAGATGLNGSYCCLALGVDNTYTGGANSATSLPSGTLTYDEA